MVYQFPSRRKRKPRGRSTKPREQPVQDIPLLGRVGNQEATREEELITRSLNKTSSVSGFLFQWRVPTRVSLPNDDKIVDWLVFSHGKKYPLEFFGRVGHGLNILQEAVDRYRIDSLNQAFEELGVEQLVPEETILYWWQNQTNDQFKWDRIVRGIFR